MRITTVQTWLMAIRPKTLPAAVAPVLIGTAMAFGDGIEHFPTAILCLLGALCIQVGTNLANDYYDFKKGTDTSQRLGPTRVTQAGLIAPGKVRAGFIFFFTLTAVICIALVNRGGWPIALIGVAAILSGIFYTAGPRPLGYLGLGDLFVLLFFGPVAVGGTYYVQSFEINMAVILAGVAPGLFSAAVLTVNNLRDMESDRSADKRTLAVRFGRSFALTEYLAAISLGGLIPVLLYGLIQDHLPILICSLVIPIAIPTVKDVLCQTDGPSLNRALASTAKLLLLYSILFSLGWIL